MCPTVLENSIEKSIEYSKERLNWPPVFTVHATSPPPPPQPRQAGGGGCLLVEGRPAPKWATGSENFGTTQKYAIFLLPLPRTTISDDPSRSSVQQGPRDMNFPNFWGHWGFKCNLQTHKKHTAALWLRVFVATQSPHSHMFINHAKSR